MSKGSMLMGTARGKLGEMVLSRRNGQQIARTYVQNVKNPRSGSQMEQRTQLANLVGMYRALKDVIAGAFESKKGYQSVYNAFVAANLNKTKVYLPKEVAASGASIIAPYKIASGSLPEIVFTRNGQNIFATSISLGEFTEAVDTTLGDFSEALVSANPSLNYGDKLTFLWLRESYNSEGYPVVQKIVFSLVLDKENLALYSVFGDYYQITSLPGIIAPVLAIVGDSASGAVTIIHTRITPSSNLVVSPAYLNLTGSNQSFGRYSELDAIQRANASYRATPDVILNPLSGNESSQDTDTELTVTVTSMSVGQVQLVGAAGGAAVISPSDSSLNGLIEVFGDNVTASRITVMYRKNQTEQARAFSLSELGTELSASAGYPNVYPSTREYEGRIVSDYVKTPNMNQTLGFITEVRDTKTGRILLNLSVAP